MSAAALSVGASGVARGCTDTMMDSVTWMRTLFAGSQVTEDYDLGSDVARWRQTVRALQRQRARRYVDALDTTGDFADRPGRFRLPWLLRGRSRASQQRAECDEHENRLARDKRWTSRAS